MMRSDLRTDEYTVPLEIYRKRTRVLICLETSSIPRDNLEIARDMSSFADASGADSLLCCFPVVEGLRSLDGRYGSPARIALA